MELTGEKGYGFNKEGDERKNSVCGMRLHSVSDRLTISEVLRGIPVILGNDSAKFFSVADDSLGLRFEVCVKDVVVDVSALMRALEMVVFEPRLVDVVQLTTTKTDEVVQAGLLNCADKSFAKCICARGARRDFNCADSSIFPEGVESVWVFSVSVANKVSGFDAYFFEPHRRVSGLLHYPVSIGMIGRGATVDLSSAEMDEYKNIGGENSSRGVDGLGKKVAGHQNVHVSVDEFAPRDGGLHVRFAGRGEGTRVLQDLACCGNTDSDAKFSQFADDSLGSPTEVVFSHQLNQFADGFTSGRSPELSEYSALPTISKPSPVCRRLDDVHYLGDVVVDQCAESNQFRPFSPRGYNATYIDSRTQHANLRLQNLEMGVVPGLKPSPEERNHDKKYSIHPTTFPSKIPANHGPNTMDTFSHHQGFRAISRKPYVGATQPLRSSHFLIGEKAAYALHGNGVDAGSRL